MRYLRPLVALFSAPAGAGALAVLLAGLAAPPARAQQFDPVEDVRTALQGQFGIEGNKAAIEARRNNLKAAAERLVSIGDMRRALALTEWRDNDIQFSPNVAAVDREIRADIAKRFTKVIDDVIASGDATTKVAAARMLGEMGSSIRGLGPNDTFGLGRTFTPQLVSLLGASEPQVREEAARALGKVNPEPKPAVAALTKTLKQDPPAVRRAAAEALADLVSTSVQLRKKGRSQSGQPSVDFKKEKELLVALMTEVVPAAGQCQKDSDAIVRRGGLSAIVQVGAAFTDLILDPEDATKMPVAGLKPENWSKYDKETVAKARGLLDEEAKLFGPLEAALKDQGDALAAALKDSDMDTRVLARQALELIGSARQRLIRRDASVPRDVGTPAMPDVLGEALKPGLLVIAKRVADPDPQVRTATIYFLETLEDGAAPAVPYLVVALSDEDRFVRWAAARTLGRIGPAHTDVSVPALARLLTREEDSDVREVVANTLRRYGTAARASAPALIALIGAGESEAREAAIRALVSVGADPKAAVPALQSALRSNAPNVRKAAADALGSYGPAAAAAVPDLRMMLDDEDGTVRIAVADALLSIGRPKQ
jgi:HEAT repeat protein